ncbi:MBL fold metallo-hydrolase [Gynuella sunshinyii]|uniref:Metal-dependent hydrolase of the beta-lactamase superfamily I n=1 Tax=Gynuella sunshinyii YC6258 TaxID=1445510 RepID=A0A0C5VMR8_9GAMM|nr:MBL fold metallo-hydrolase [Gynuella sunshinyii]AJQ94633.1 metal-dependent hydrolase of the beta-lactamase superfamily I [Gynuella sunshinyii YC6258]
MQFASLGSGSKGNSTLVRTDQTVVMVDCGFSVKDVEQRLARLSLSPANIDAVLVTHEHGDHIKGVAALCRRYDIPVFSSFGTWQSVRNASGVCHTPINLMQSFNIGDLMVEPVAVPHDAREPCQFVFQDRYHRRLGILTDCGHVTDHMISCYQNCHSLLLECNHDLEMLRNGPYPMSLKRRVGGLYGHLNNEQAGDFLNRVAHNGLQHVVITHISEQNNEPELAVHSLARVMTHISTFPVIDQEDGLDWHNILLPDGSNNYEERQTTVFR